MRALMPEPLGQTLPRMIEDLLADARAAVVVENGAVLFDLATAHYSIAADHGKCLLHFWSEERNTVRRVLAAEAKRDAFLLTVQRFGQPKPSRMEICATGDYRTPSARRAARAAYQRLLAQVLAHEFSGWHVEKLTSGTDLERSFGPAHTRGLLRRGQSAVAVVGTSAGETQAMIDASVATDILWLDHCRQQFADRAYVEGLALFVPRGTADVVRQRMAYLDRAAAKWRLFEVAERDAAVEELDCSDTGNIATRLLRCPDEAAARERFAGSIARVRGVAPAAEVVVVSAGDVSFRVHGLEFAHARLAPEAQGLRSGEEIVFGLGAAESVLAADNEATFAALARRLLTARHAGGARTHPLWRAAPERWLESLLVRDVSALDATLDATQVYAQVPAFSAADRGVVDVLAATHTGRLVVVELKADEDLHLPLQGLDYWIRVKWHHERGEFQRLGYFNGRDLSLEPPLLLLVAPALRVHPATETLLRYFAPEVDWVFVAIDERWRDEVRVIFRKQRPRGAAA